MAKVMEMVLYYNPGTPESLKHTAMMKSVLVRMGVKIRNIAPEQVLETVGYLAGVPGEKSREERLEQDTETAGVKAAEKLPEITEQVLVMKNFSGRRIDELLSNLRRAGVPKIDLKAVLTEHNSSWTFYHLYEELKEEHQAMTSGGSAEK